MLVDATTCSLKSCVMASAAPALWQSVHYASTFLACVVLELIQLPNAASTTFAHSLVVVLRTILC